MDREQIIHEIESLIKALKANNGWWENRGRGGWFNHDTLEDALALIKELTEENERLRFIIYEATEREKENLRLTNEIHSQIKKLPALAELKFAEVKADTVRKMQNQLKMEFDRFGRKDGFITKETIYWFIDQIAKEMLEGEK